MGVQLRPSVELECSVVGRAATQHYEGKGATSKNSKKAAASKKEEKCICEICTCGRHKCRHNPGGSNKSSILPLEDYKGNIIGEVMTREQKMDFERRHSQATLMEESQLTSLQKSTIEKRSSME